MKILLDNPTLAEFLNGRQNRPPELPLDRPTVGGDYRGDPTREAAALKKTAEV